ncbi:MAG: hypothetical protein JWR19_3150 [Pedosphaera sp.]|nr:hypothetical protein [Pedosphaera sp.]
MVVKWSASLLFATMVLAGVSNLNAQTNTAAQDQQNQNGNNQGQQGGRPGRNRNYDPTQMRQQMMDRLREKLVVKDDEEWKLIEERITKVMDVRREMMGGFGGFRGNNRPGGDTNANPEADALQKALDAKASPDEIKTRLAAFREAHKAKQAKLEAAQEELRKVLTQNQEAIAVLNGVLQ